MSEKETFENITKNGIPIKEQGYKLGWLARASKQELITEILGSFEYDYLLECEMVEYNAIKTRDRALKVLEKNGFAWAENPLHPNHDHLTYTNGDELESQIETALQENLDVTQAVWDLCNIWAMSDERQALVEEYAKNCEFN